MFSIRNISIRGKLILMQMLTSLVVLGLCFSAFIYTDIKGYKERKIRSSLAIATVVGTNNVSSLQFGDNSDAAISLAELGRVETDVEDAVLLDSKGAIFARYTREGSKPHKFSFPLQDKVYELSGHYLYVCSIIKKDNDKMGAVCIEFELTQLENIKKEIFQISTILLIIGVGLAFLIAIINQGYISKPILSLVSVMRTIRESDDYKHHVPVRGKDEISILSLEFNNLMDEVVKSHQKKDEFIGVASHELKTPLTSVKAYLQLLQKIEKEQPNLTYVEKAQENVSKLQNLIFDLLDVSKISSGQLQLEIREFNIDELVNECNQNAQLSTNTHKITRKGELTNGIISADRDRIEQVIVNLLSNAIKYSPQGKEIIVSSQKYDSEVMIAVQDFGVGIPKSEAKKVFERFYRATGRQFGISGFGLGLYICNEIVKRHGGRIWVESDLGKGSTFFFTLPILDA
jgi:signal transduction histidine kinase